MTPPEPWSNAPGWREFFDLLSDAVVVFDTQARVVMANTAALRLLPCEAGASLDQLKPALGTAATQWLKRAASGSFLGTAAPLARLADGRTATMVWRRLDPQHSALRLSPPAVGHAQPAPGLPNVSSVREALALFWESPFPASLQGPDFCLIDVNQAMLDYTGYAREQLIGRDPQLLMPADDQAEYAVRRERLQARAVDVNEPGLKEGRLFDASGRERRYRVARRTLRGDRKSVV